MLYRSALFSDSIDGQPKFPSNYVKLQATQDPRSISRDLDSFDYDRNQFDDDQVIDQRRLVASPSDKYSHFPRNNLKR